jgi:hypothetical protein
MITLDAHNPENDISCPSPFQYDTTTQKFTDNSSTCNLYIHQDVHLVEFDGNSQAMFFHW